MIALLRTPRWTGFTALALVAIIGFGFLSRWQWQRAEEQRIERLTIEQGVELEGFTSDISGLDPFSRVQVRGNYLDDYTVLVRQRPQDGSNGFWVVTPLATTAQDGAVWVIRGWVPTSTNALDKPTVGSAPVGEVEVTGAVRDFELARNDVSGLPEGVISRVSTSELPDVGMVQDRTLQLISSDPVEAIVPVELPSIDEGQNISYAVQWIIFAAIAMGGWFIFLRREAQDNA